VSVVLIQYIPAYVKSVLSLIDTDLTYTHVPGDQGGPLFFRLRNCFLAVIIRTNWHRLGAAKINQMRRAPMSDVHSLSTYVDCTNFKSYFPRQMGHSYFLSRVFFYDFFIETHLAP
jgi:hypothetical protein